jgi:hypothetical protein
MTPRLRLLMLALDGIALVGLAAFSVGGALDRDNTFYLAGQIVCAVLILWSVFVLRRANHDAAEGNAASDTGPEHPNEEDTGER